jgi:hypothetical protein
MISIPKIASIKIKLKTINGDALEISIDNALKVHDLKQIIENKLNIPSRRQRLIFQGRVLNEEMRLIDYKIEDGHVIHLVEQNVTLTNDIESNNRGHLNNLNENFININPNPDRMERYSNFLNMLLNHNSGSVSSNVNSGSSGFIPSSNNPFQSIFANTITNSLLNSLNINSNQSTTYQIPDSFKNLERPYSFNKIQSIEVIKQNINLIKEIIKNTQHIDNFQSAYKTTKKLFNISNTYSRKYINYKIGQWVDAKDSLDQWAEAQIIDIKENDNLALLKFLPQISSSTASNEWISMNSERITLFRTYTLQSPFSKYNSAFPNSKSESELVMTDIGNFDKFDNLDDLINFMDNLREKIIKIIQTKEALYAKKSRFYENKITEEEITSREKILCMLIMQVYPLMDRIGRLFTDFSNYLYNHSFNKFQDDLEKYKTNFSSNLFEERNTSRNMEEILNKKINMFKELTVIPVMRNTGEVAEAYNLTRPRMGLIVADLNGLGQNINNHGSTTTMSSNLTQPIQNNSAGQRIIPRSIKFENLQISKIETNLNILNEIKKKKISNKNFIASVNSFYILGNKKSNKNESKEEVNSTQKNSKNENLQDYNNKNIVNPKSSSNLIFSNKSQMLSKEKIIIEAKDKNIKLSSKEFGNKNFTNSSVNINKDNFNPLAFQKRNHKDKTSILLRNPTKSNLNTDLSTRNKVYKIKAK